MKKLLLIAAVFLSLSGSAHAQTTEARTTPECQQLYGANFVYDSNSNSCKDQNYNPAAGTGGADYNCPTGQTYSSTGNNGAGGCVASPSITNPATPNYDCPTGQTYSSTGNYGAGGCVTDPSASANTTGSGGNGVGGTGGGNNSAYTSATSPTSQSTPKGKLTYTPLEPLPGGDNAGNTTYNSLSAYLQLMFNILLSIGAMIAVVSLVFAGITYIISEVVERKAAAKRRITASFIGLGLLLTSWLILYTINPNLVQKLCIFQLDAQCGGATQNSLNGPNASATTPNPTPNPQELQKQEAACKAKGPTYAFYVDTSGTSCYDLNY